MLADDGQRFSAFALGGDHPLTSLVRNLHRLLDDDVLPGFQRRDGSIAMKAAGRAETDDVDVFVGKKLLLVVVDFWDDELLGQRFGAFRQHISDGDEFGVLNLPNGGRMRGPNGPAAHNTETDFTAVILVCWHPISHQRHPP